MSIPSCSCFRAADGRQVIRPEILQCLMLKIVNQGRVWHWSLSDINSTISAIVSINSFNLGHFLVDFCFTCPAFGSYLYTYMYIPTIAEIKHGKISLLFQTECSSWYHGYLNCSYYTLYYELDFTFYQTDCIKFALYINYGLD